MFICKKCGYEWDDKKAFENEYCCTKKCGGNLNEFKIDGSLISLADRLPSVIAFPFHEYLLETNPNMKLWHACDTIELAFRLFFMLGIADIISRQKTFPKELAKKLKNNIEMPTLGKWKAMALEVSKEITNDSTVNELMNCIKNEWTSFCDGEAKPKTIYTSFIELRNNLAHGGGITKIVAQNLINLWACPFEELIKKTEWLTEILLIVKKADGGYGLLRGHVAEPENFSPETRELAESLKNSFSRGEEIVVVRKGTSLSLRIWPLALFGSPKLPVDSINKPPERKFTPQMYVRRGESSLHFTPIGSPELCHSESGLITLEDFEDLFRLRSTDNNQNSEYKVFGFESDIRKDSASMVGRKSEIDEILNILNNQSEGVFWLTGQAGSGKSFLIARIAEELLSAASNNTLILPYRFKNNDRRRCGREPFLQFIMERLNPWLKNKKYKFNNDFNFNEMFNELKKLLENLSDRNIIFIIDGLDEINELDQKFASDVILKLKLTGVIWLCAGRPIPSLDKLFSPDRCRHIFPGGIKPMGSADIRAMIIEKIGPLRRNNILIGDIENDSGKIENPFIEKVKKNSEGLPIYVKYVIGDILNNKFRALDVGEDLPPSLDEYYEKLLNDHKISDLNFVLTPLACILAIAKEPLSKDELLMILNYGKVLTDRTGDQILDQALSRLGPMIRSVKKQKLIDGFMLYHLTLKRHLFQSDQISGAIELAYKNIHEMICDKTLWKGKAASYLLRWGIKHLIESPKMDEVERLLTDLDFIEAKCEAGMTHELVNDYQEALSKMIDKNQSNNIMTDEQVINEIFRIKKNPNIFDKINVYSQFVNSQAHNFVKFSQQKGFIAQQAYNYSDCEIFLKAAKIKISEIQSFSLGLLKPDCLPRFNPKPALLRTLEGHKACVNSVSITHDGKTAVSAAYNILSKKSGLLPKADDVNKILLIWDVDSGKCIQELKGHENWISSTAITPDGKIAISGSDDHTVRIWNVESGVCEQILKGHEDKVNCVSITPDGKMAISGSDDHTVRIWNIESGECLWIFKDHENIINCVSITPDAKTAISGSDDQTIRIWNIESGICVQTLHGHESSILSIAITPDAETLISACYNALRIWKVKDGSCRQNFQENCWLAVSIALTPDGKYFVLGSSDESIQIWDTESGKCLKTIETNSDFICSVAITPDCNTVITGSLDNIVRIWNILSGINFQHKGHKKSVNSLAITPDGKTAISGSDDQTIRIWDTESGNCLNELKEQKNNVHSIAITPDGKIAISGGSDKTVRIWNIISGKCLQELKGHEYEIQSVAITSDSKIAVSGDGEYVFKDNYICYTNDNCLRIWEIETGNCIKKIKGHKNIITSVCITPDNKHIVSASRDGDIKIWSIRSGKLIKKIIAHRDFIQSVTVTPDCKTLLSGSSDKTIKAWDINTGKFLSEFNGHTDIINSVGITPDGKYLISSSEDKTIKAWNIRSGICLLTIALQSPANSISIDNKYNLIAGEKTGKVSIFSIKNLDKH